MRKNILSIIGVLLIVTSFFYAKKLIANKKKPRPVAAKVVKTVFTGTIQNSTMPIIISANGNLTTKQYVELYCEVEGVFRPWSYLLKLGQNNRKGQTLIRVDVSEYYATVKSSKKTQFFNFFSVYYNVAQLSKNLSDLEKTLNILEDRLVRAQYHSIMVKTQN